MSYLVLARKSRPQSFDQVIGQRSVVKTLQNSLERNRVAHAILFSGVRGVGKTTLARIMAKAINCEQRDNNPPCNKCLSCKEITSGSALDLHEIDGASNRGIQEIRELKEKVRFLPTSSKYRIIIIDEVHMLTTEAFNALLKTLEEPPEHVHFMFATTELHKIPVTILSRCQQYELKRVSADELSNHFTKLIEAEGKSIDSDALSLIVREASGSVRDGLSLLDQVLSFSEDKVTTADVVEVLGLIDRDVLMSLTRALLDGNKSQTFLALDQIFKFGMDIKRFCTDLINQFRTLLLTKIDGCQPLIDLPEQEFLNFKEIATHYTTESLHQTMSMLIEMVENIGQSSQPRLVLEVTFLKIIEVGNVVSVSDLLGQFDSVLKLGVSSTQVNTPAPPTPVKKKTVPVKEEPTQPEPVTQNAPTPKPKEQTAPKITETAPPLEKKTKKDVKANWDKFLSFLHENAPWLAPSLTHTAKVEVEENTILLYFDDTIHCTLLQQENSKEEIHQFLLDFFNRALRVKVVLPDMKHQENKQSTSTKSSVSNELSNHPLVTATTEIFRGHVASVRPKNTKL